MIRDPSDGTVKEKPKPDLSGLPKMDSEKQDELERLEKSREWLKDWKGRIEK